MERTRLVHTSFALTTLITIVLFAVTKSFYVATTTLAIGLIGFFWYWNLKSTTTTTALVSSNILILLHAVGASFNLYPMSFAGTTYDSWMHIIAAFITVMLATEYFHDAKHDNEKRALLYAGITAVILGLGVEGIEVLSEAFLKNNGFLTECLNSFCTYWQDTVKDIFNDVLGILLFVVARTSRKELLRI